MKQFKRPSFDKETLQYQASRHSYGFDKEKRYHYFQSLTWSRKDTNALVKRDLKDTQAAQICVRLHAKQGVFQTIKTNHILQYSCMDFAMLLDVDATADLTQNLVPVWKMSKTENMICTH